MDDWNSHNPQCKLKKIVLKPDPRYPLPKVSEKLKEDQIRIQERSHKLLQNALDGNFTVEVFGGYDDSIPSLEEYARLDSSSEKEDSFLVQNPEDGLDLAAYEEYKLRMNNEEIKFKWIGVDPLFHSIPKGILTSCSLFRYMSENLDFVEDNLHHLLGCLPEEGQEFFWNMLINFNTYGTVALFHGPCQCSRNNDKAQMRPQWSEARKKWNKIFKRAKADINDVQCMFSDTKEGCHNYSDCPYKHDKEVIVEKRKKK